MKNIEDIKESAPNFFGYDLGVQRVENLPFQLHQVSDEMRKAMETMPTEDKVKEIVFSIDGDSLVIIIKVSQYLLVL